MRRFRLLVLGAAVIATANCAPESRESADKAPAPSLSCAQRDSLIGGALRYSDEIHGTVNTAGGTRIALLPSDSVWTMVLTPVASDFPDEPNRWVGDEDPETLPVTWRSASPAEGVVFPKALHARRDTSLMRLDSITFAASCASLSLRMWSQGAAFDSARMPRPPDYWQ